jgi:hypothetical protein
MIIITQRYDLREYSHITWARLELAIRRLNGRISDG